QQKLQLRNLLQMNTVRSQSLPPSESSSLPSANQQKSIPNQAPSVDICTLELVFDGTRCCGLNAVGL
ncbi:unnamed protein product, partial [Rotaria socialis]